MSGHRQLVIGVVGTSRAWRSELASHIREHIDTITIRVAYDPSRLVEGPFDAVIVDDVTSWVTKPLVDRLSSAGTLVFGIFDPDEAEGQGARYLESLGVTLTIPATCAPADLAARLLDLLDRPASISPARAGTFAHNNLTTNFGGSITVIGGPGGTGVTEFAICLAERIAARHQRVILVDLDDRAPGLAMRLDTDPSPHILGALDAAGRGDDIINHVARAPSGHRTQPFHLIVGAGSATDWLRIRADEVTELLDQLRRWDHAIINVGSEMDANAGLGPSRYPATTGALQRADRVIGVCDGSAFHSIGRYLNWFAAVAQLTPPGGRVLTAVNRLPARNPERRLSIEEALTAHLPADRRAGFVWLPHDRHVLNASWTCEHVQRGQFRREIEGIAELLAPRARHGRTSPPDQAPASAAPIRATAGVGS